MGRDPKHDYKGRCIYHITIGKAPACPAFSRISGSPAAPVVARSPVGEIIERQIVKRLSPISVMFFLRISMTDTCCPATSLTQSSLISVRIREDYWNEERILFSFSV